MNAKELEALVIRCLERGVPPSVVADVFDLDPALVKEAQKSFHIRAYNTDDLSEYIEYLRWKTVEDALRVLETGSAAEKARVHTMILGKEVALSARRTPESVRASQDSVLSLLEGMRSGKAKPQAEPSKFIARREDESA